MADEQIRFDDGEAYEDFMGKWSLLAGNAFLDWLAPAAGLRWVDVGCGNGAFTELLVQRCAAARRAGHRPVGRAARLRAQRGSRGARGTLPPRRRDGAALAPTPRSTPP